MLASTYSIQHWYTIQSYCDILTVLAIWSGLPYAMSGAGFFTGISLLVVFSATADWAIRLIVLNAKFSVTKS